MWNVTSVPKVTSGSARRGDGSTRRLKNARNCSVLIRLRTLSCATISAPASARLSLPPVWSPCQCVLRMNCTGFGVIAPTAAWIFGASGAY